MLSDKPLFVDMSGNSLRIDLPKVNHSTYVRVTVTISAESDEAGLTIAQAKVIEFWISTEACKQVSDAFAIAGDPNLNKIMG